MKAEDYIVHGRHDGTVIVGHRDSGELFETTTDEWDAFIAATYCGESGPIPVPKLVKIKPSKAKLAVADAMVDVAAEAEPVVKEAKESVIKLLVFWAGKMLRGLARKLGV